MMQPRTLPDIPGGLNQYSREQGVRLIVRLTLTFIPTELRKCGRGTKLVSYALAPVIHSKILEPVNIVSLADLIVRGTWLLARESQLEQELLYM
jgi:hypothetical protein